MRRGKDSDGRAVDWSGLAYSRAMREVVAKRIIEMAQRGVRDREALVTDALQFIAANYEQPTKLTS